MQDPISERTVYRTVQYRRALDVSGACAFTALTRTVDLLGYARREHDPERGTVRFHALGRTVEASVVDADAARCTVVVAFPSLCWMGSGGSALVILPGVLLGAALKAHDAYFARGFLDNVWRVLEGNGVGRDSAHLPGMGALRERLELGEGEWG